MCQFVDDICELIRKDPTNFRIINVETEFTFPVRVVEILWYKVNFYHLKDTIIKNLHTQELFEFKYIPDDLMIDPEILIQLLLEKS